MNYYLFCSVGHWFHSGVMSIIVINTLHIFCKNFIESCILPRSVFHNKECECQKSICVFPSTEVQNGT